MTTGAAEIDAWAAAGATAGGGAAAGAFNRRPHNESAKAGTAGRWLDEWSHLISSHHS